MKRSGTATIALSLLCTTYSAEAQSVRKDRTREMKTAFSWQAYFPAPAVGKSGSFYGVDEQGGFLRFKKPGTPQLAADGFSVFYDVAIKGNAAYYIGSDGYLAKSNLKNFTIKSIAYCGSFNALDFSPAGKLHAMSADSTYLYQIDTGTGKYRSVLDVGYYSDGDICFVSNSIILLTSTSGELVRIDLKKRTSTPIMNLGSGEWYSMDYRSKKVHLIDNVTGNYFVVGYPSLKYKTAGNIYNNPVVAGLNGLSFR